MTATSRWHPLTGGTAVWLVMAVEVLTFGMFLITHAYSWSSEPQAYLASQARLHPDSATLGTILLLLGSWAAYEATLAAEANRLRPAAAWLVATALSVPHQPSTEATSSQPGDLHPPGGEHAWSQGP